MVAEDFARFVVAELRPHRGRLVTQLRNRTEFFLDTPEGPTYPAPVDPGLLAISHVFTDDEQDAFLTRAPDLDTYTVAAEALIPWFADAWREAGGTSFPLSASIGIHDDLRRLDLRSQAWLA